MFESFDFQQMISAFIVLFAVIDIIGSIPIIINLKEKGKDVNAMKEMCIRDRRSTAQLLKTTLFKNMKEGS